MVVNVISQGGPSTHTTSAHPTSQPFEELHDDCFAHAQAPPFVQTPIIVKVPALQRFTSLCVPQNAARCLEVKAYEVLFAGFVLVK